MTDDPVPCLPAQTVSRAAQQLTALADLDPAALLAAVLRLAAAEPCALTELAADQGCDLRTLTRNTAMLEAAGLLTGCCPPISP